MRTRYMLPLFTPGEYRPRSPRGLIYGNQICLLRALYMLRVSAFIPALCLRVLYLWDSRFALLYSTSDFAMSRSARDCVVLDASRANIYICIIGICICIIDLHLCIINSYVPACAWRFHFMGRTEGITSEAAEKLKSIEFCISMAL